ncbi:hypothetical protein [Oceanibaculum indicum]|uniref:Uncharacterized protein n=1 Tax=Oceanibaculum indicum TaxID=526216 RepID=A0A420WGK1_9PROT|nr:hypothetical protein [Oceanibaculum indicum]RKQ70128.1 hypothetical protein BCL74_2068 [Oceanibaculum indicum]
MRDLHHNINIIAALPPVAVGTTGTGKTSSVVDRQGYDAVEFAFSYGAITATAATFTATIQHSDSATAASFTSVADVDLLGTEAAAGLGQGARVDGSTENVTRRVGYIGAKRYVRARVVSTATAGTPVGINALLGHPRHAPAAT